MRLPAVCISLETCATRKGSCRSWLSLAHPAKHFATIIRSCFINVVIRFRSRLETVFAQTFMNVLDGYHRELQLERIYRIE